MSRVDYIQSAHELSRMIELCCPSHGLQSCDKGILYNLCYEPCRRAPQQMGQSEDSRQNIVRWRRRWQPTPEFLPVEPHEQCMKRQKISNNRKMALGQKVSNMICPMCPIWKSEGANTNKPRKNEEAGPKQK